MAATPDPLQRLSTDSFAATSLAGDTSAAIEVQTARGHRTMLFSHAVRVLCKAASVLILARLVSPSQHGLYAMAASLTLLLTVFRDFGLGTVAIQTPHLDAGERTTLLWAHVAIGCVLALLGIALTPALVWFYATPEAAPLAVLMCASLVFTGINAWPRVLLARELQFATLNRLETTAVLIGTAVMIGSAALGAGAYAFACFLLTFEGLLVFTAWRACAWRPAGRPRWQRLAPLLRRGASVTGYTFVVHISGQLDTLAIGKWFGSAVLGLYNRSSQLMLLPAQHISAPLGQVLLSSLSRSQSSGGEIRQQLRSASNLILYLTLPLAIVCIALPAETARVVLGAKWLDAAPFIQWLAVGAIASAMGSTAYPLSVAFGRTRRLALLSLVSLLVTIAAIIIARPSGPVGVARAVVLANTLLLLPRLWWITQDSSVSLRDYASAYFSPIVFLATCVAGARGGSSLVPASDWMLRWSAGVGGALAAGLLLSSLWPRLRAELHNVWAHRPGLRELQSVPGEDSA
jgi:PST family polysaccharide transporter